MDGNPLSDPASDDSNQTENAIYTWWFINPETDELEQIGTTAFGQSLNDNPFGISGEGASINNLPGSFEGTNYRVYITVGECVINEGIPL